MAFNHSHRSLVLAAIKLLLRDQAPRAFTAVGDVVAAGLEAALQTYDVAHQATCGLIAATRVKRVKPGSVFKFSKKSMLSFVDVPPTEKTPLTSVQVPGGTRFGYWSTFMPDTTAVHVVLSGIVHKQCEQTGLTCVISGCGFSAIDQQGHAAWVACDVLHGIKFISHDREQ